MLRSVQAGRTTRVGGDRDAPFSGRIVAATNRTPGSGAPGVRPDLFHRLAGLVLRLPPLRERPGDLEPLVRMSGCPAPTDAGMAVLSGHRWPGNVRELQHVLERTRWLAGGSRPGPDVVAEAIEQGGWPEGGTDVGPATGPRGRRKDQIARSGLPRSTFYHRLKRGRLPPELLEVTTAD